MKSRDDETSSNGSRTDVEDIPESHVEIAPVRRGMVLAERWVVEDVLGRGGMGVVVRAYDRTLCVAVAIKIVRAELAGERLWAERLAREVKLARQIHHPNVCRVFDLGQDQGRVFLVMELASNGTLRDELRARATYAKRPLAHRLADAQAVAAGLAAIHTACIVHRDMSPQNLLRMADGRLVVSDFGLATDAAESSTSVHGGTIAYMAPELVHGGCRASVASDVWALGIVIHEIVFGERPAWREPGGLGEPPALGRPLTPEEVLAFEVCRSCTATAAKNRTVTALEVAQMLAAGGRPRRSLRARPLARTLAAVVVACAIIASTSAAFRYGTRRSSAAPDQLAGERSPLIVATGEPADWTDTSIVLAEVPERIHCTSLLPDQKTIRFVWGSPRRAEDVDTTNGRRMPSPLLPRAYAESCPDVSPDGKRMLFTGRTPDKRAFAFVSERSDGSDAVPVVQVAEPTMSSDPTWMADGQSFSYEADMKHMAAFSMLTKRAIVLPQATNAPSFGSLRHVVRDQVFVVSGRIDGQGEVLGLAWPGLEEQVRFRFKRTILDVQSRDGRTYYCTTPMYESATPILAITPIEQRAKAAGFLRDQVICYPRFVAGGLTFVSIRMQDVLFIRAPDGRWEPLMSGSSIRRAVPCGTGFAVTRVIQDRQTIARLESGKFVSVSEGPEDAYAACSADGRVLFYASLGTNPAIHRCDEAGCRVLAQIAAAAELAVSPDGERLAFAVSDHRGPMIQWISTHGGAVHDVVETETLCRPGWSSNRTLWVSRREAANIVWTEVEAEGGRPTGRRVPGSHDCFDGGEDPASPVNLQVRVVSDRRSQVRLLAAKYLE